MGLETPTEAVVWFGDHEANAIIEGPQRDAVIVAVSTGTDFSRFYEVRCPGCHCLTQYLPEYGLPAQWGCYGCYCKYVLLTEPADREPYGWWPDAPQAHPHRATA